VNVPFARRLKISVDRLSCVGGKLSFYVDCTCTKPFKVFHQTTEPSVHQKPEVFYVQGADIWYTYQHAPGASITEISANWGFEFQVTVADDKDSSEARWRGMLLQAKFRDVPAGSYQISAVMNQQVYELPSCDLATIAFEGSSAASELEQWVLNSNYCLQVDATKSLTHGLQQARIIGIDGRAVQGKESARLMGNVPGDKTVNMVIHNRCDGNAHMRPEEYILKKVASVKNGKNENYVGATNAKL